MVLKLKSEEQMDAVAARAEAMGLPWYIVVCICFGSE